MLHSHTTLRVKVRVLCLSSVVYLLTNPHQPPNFQLTASYHLKLAPQGVVEKGLVALSRVKTLYFIHSLLAYPLLAWDIGHDGHGRFQHQPNVRQLRRQAGTTTTETNVEQGQASG